MQHPSAAHPPPRPVGAARSGESALLYGGLGTPVGRVWVTLGSAGVVRVSLGSIRETALTKDLASRWPRASLRRDERHPGVAAVLREISEYFDGERRRFSVAVDLSAVTPFGRRVLERAREVPCGSVVTYGEIAAALGRPGAGRAVGGALSRNPVPILVPCHRVIAASGRIGGFTVGADPRSTGTKRALLDLERAMTGA